MQMGPAQDNALFCHQYSGTVKPGNVPAISKLKGHYHKLRDELHQVTETFRPCKQHFSQSVLKKVIITIATKCYISKTKRTKFDFGWDSTPDHTTRDCLARFRMPTFKEKKRKAKKRKEMRKNKKKKRKIKGQETRICQIVTVCHPQL